MPDEIERKFLLSGPPQWLGDCDSQRIEQGYLALEPDREVRLRRIDSDRSVLTVKRGHGERRLEEEVELEAGQIERLWALTEGRRVSKRRHLAPRPEGTYEIDVYEGELAGLVVAELEFDSERRSAAFEPPDWLGRELTGDGRYENRSLATRGRPED
jgi:adenylate cyclase